MRRAVLLAGAALAVCAATALSAGDGGKQTRAVRRGQAFAVAHCSGYHGVTPGSVSDNPESPPFEDIANRDGVTRQTLRRFLRDSHNFPDAMNFRLDARRIGDLADYLLTLRRPAYKPAI